MANPKSFQSGDDNVDISSLLSTIDSLISTSGISGMIDSADSADTVDSASAARPQNTSGSFNKGDFSDTQLDEISKGVKAGLPVELYAKKCYNWMQMFEIRQGLLAGMDTTIYDSPLYSASQMRQIRLGLLDGLDVTSYATLLLSASDMKRIREALFASAYKLHPASYGRKFTDDETGILIRISDDCLKAYITLPKDLPEDFEESDLLSLLETYEIKYGVNEDLIGKLFTKNRPVNQEILIAQGKRPIVGKSGWYELFFENNIEKGHTVPPDGEVDYTDVNTVDSIRPGDKLMCYHPAQKDIGGITVTGIEVEGIKGEELPVLTGVGFQYDKDSGLYTATTSGCASYNDTTWTLNVWKIYNVAGDVCYYQSLEYDGTVHVSGSVRTMSTIRAKGDIIVDGFVESATICSEQNVVIKGGCNGGGQGKIEAGGSVRANFFENMDVVAKGLVEANYYFNSNIETEDRIVARGKKARIIGGRIAAALSVDAIIVGNYLSSKTLFNVGDIKSLNKKVTALASDRKIALEELQQLAEGKQKMLNLLEEDQLEGNTLYDKLCNAIHTKELQVNNLDHEISRLQKIIQRADNAYIKIHGQLQSDAIFIINNIKKETPTATNRSIQLTRKDCQPPRKKQ